MEVKFGENQTAAAEVLPPAPTNIEPVQSAAPPTPTQLPATIKSTVPAGPSGLILGDKIPDFKDIILPRVNIVQNIGELKATFEPGTIVFNQQIVLFVPGKIDPKTNNVLREATAPTLMTVLGFRPTRYVEKIEGGARGAIVDTEEEVRNQGGTLDYKEWELKKASGMRRFEALADALVAVERPSSIAEDGADFIYEVDGKHLALGLWAMRGVSYTAAAKRVFFTARAVGCLRKGGYPSWQYAVSTRMVSYPGGHSAWQPICLPVKQNNEAFLNFAREVLTGS